MKFLVVIGEKLQAVSEKYLLEALKPLALKGDRGDRGDKGDPGRDGVSVRGAPGADGVSIRGDKGEKGDKGDRGEKGEPGLERPGAPGAPGNDGKDGRDGQPGRGLPAGGRQGQVLTKASIADYDTVWRDMPVSAHAPPPQARNKLTGGGGKGEKGDTGPAGPPGPSGGTADLTRTAARDLSGQRVVKTLGGGFVDYASSDDLGDVLLLEGLTVVAADLNSAVAVRAFGEIVEPSWNWQLGPLYCGLNGELTQAVPGVGWLRQVATAVDSNRIIVQLADPVVLA